jgi:hypothetical protein
MIRDIVKTLCIAAALSGIVSFFALAAPTNRFDSVVQTSTYEIEQSSAVLENLIMKNEPAVVFSSTFAECPAD